MAYLELDMHVAPRQKEALLAWLEPLPFEAFEETEQGWKAYLRAVARPSDLEDQLAGIRSVIPFTYHIRQLEDKNWNEEWESHFSPVRVGNFCHVRAPFHSSLPDTTYELVIQPRMAFGTGHHETTYMMIEQMQSLPVAGKRVLDFGCGTGVLAILAARMGAGEVQAVDIERSAVDNARENARLNGVQIDVRQGSLSAAVPPAAKPPDGRYDIVLANITRNVITSHLRALFERIVPEGVLLLSGVLKKESLLLKTELVNQGFEWEHTQHRGEWICMRVLRP